MNPDQETADVVDETQDEVIEDSEQEAADAGQDKDTADADDAGKPDDDAPEPPITKREKRVAELTGMNHALVADRDYWRSRAQNQDAAPAMVAEVKQPEAPAKPKLEDFDNDVTAFTDATTDYIDKKVEFEAAKAKADIVNLGQEEQAKVAVQERIAKFNERSTKFAESHPDFYDIVANPTLNITQPMTDMIIEMENGSAVTYYLGLHPEVAARIALKETPVALAMAMADAERKALSEQSDKSETVRTDTTSAPQPHSTVSGGRGHGGKLDPRNPEHSKKMTDGEWMKRRKAQLRKQANG